MRSIFTERVPFSYVCYELLPLFLQQRIVGKERNGKTIATANRRFYVVKNGTQLNAVFAGKGINALPLENQVCKALIFNASSAFIP